MSFPGGGSASTGATLVPTSTEAAKVGTPRCKRPLATTSVARQEQSSHASPNQGSGPWVGAKRRTTSPLTGWLTIGSPHPAPRAPWRWPEPGRAPSSRAARWSKIWVEGNRCPHPRGRAPPLFAVARTIPSLVASSP